MLRAVNSLRARAPALGRAMSAKPHTFELSEYQTHCFDDSLLPTSVEATAEEMETDLRMMLTMRRMEIALDTAYKAQEVRGFCHLADGQEAVALGVERGLAPGDGWITSYRCHSVAVARGIPVDQVLAELFGFKEGASSGKGGSMHLYSGPLNFYGGAGIVGAQVPVGAGVAFANRYNAVKNGTDEMNVCIAAYGDGAANQGQIWEAANMSALWKLPTIFLIENNQYGMGTAMERSSSNYEYFTMGNKIPGIRLNGMDLLSSREGIKAARKWCAEGNGPIYVEAMTYRYHGHSMSDPGTSYRDREEIQNVRASRDPIEGVKAKMIEAGFATADEIKAIEKEVRKQVNKDLKKAKSGSPPPLSDCYTDVYANEDGTTQYEPFLRTPDFTQSLVNGVPPS